ncbi:MAG TPA: hypothetical protein VM260_01885 [Pirellula sp.]|nr:hypothetical protein [Pirellula sp.]
MNTKTLGFASLIGLAATFACAPPSPPPIAGTAPNLAQEKSSEVSKATQSGAMADSNAVTEHGHKSGEHGGIMVSLGRDSYHIEAVFEADGAVRLYTLGNDESRVIDVESQTLKGFVKVEGETNANSIVFEALPQDGDAPNRTSRFIGKLPQELVGKNLEVTVPNVNISGERFRLGFRSVTAAHDTSDAATGMPDKLAGSEEHDLYLVPGGRYTAADIAANGNTTASKKFRGIKSSHDMFPKDGDRICPITETKANPKFTWVVDGKAYLFCCPPCVDEFVKTAKASSDPLAEPDSYVK